VRGSIENNADHVALARRAALEGTVLLKNDNGTLPIKRSAVHTIAVIGATVPYHVVFTENGKGFVDFAHDVRLGDLGSSRVYGDPAKSTGSSSSPGSPRRTRARTTPARPTAGASPSTTRTGTRCRTTSSSRSG
jgi:beta-glucosidase-like glycosyl hydrolase